MARSHARLLVTIWADPDWRRLPRDCQWFYELLLSQPGITHCGVVQIPRRGWVNCSADDDNAEAIANAMKILADREYLVVDEDTDEVLVRSFMRHDGVVSGPPGTLKNALVAARAVASPRIRSALHAELSKVDRAEIAAKRVREGHEHPLRTLEVTLNLLAAGPSPSDDTPRGDAIGDGIADGLAMGSGTPGDGIANSIESNGIADGMSYGPGVGEGVGVSSSLSVGSNSSSVGTATRRGSRTLGARIPDDFTVTDAMRSWARTHTPLVGQAETDTFIDYWQSEVGPKARKLDWVKAWQVWMRREQKQAEKRPAHLRTVQAAPAAPLRTFDDFRRAAAARDAARLLRVTYMPPEPPPGDPTPYPLWMREQAVKFLDAHEADLRAALTETRTG